MDRTLYSPSVAAASAHMRAAGIQFRVSRPSGTDLSFGLLLLFLLLLYANIAVLMPSLEVMRPMLVIALAAIATLWLEKAVAGQEFVLVWPESHLLITFLAAAALSVPAALWTRQAAEYTMDFAKIVTIYFLIINTVDSEKRLRIFMWCMVLGGLIPALATIRNYLTGLTGSDGRTAWIGFFANPNELAISLAILIPIAVSLGLSRGFFTKISNWGIVAVYVAAIFVTYSRGGFVGLIFVLGLTALRLQKSRSVPVIAFLMLAAAAIYLNSHWTRGEGFANLQADVSVQQRIATIRAGIDMFLDHPVFGVGIGCFIVGWPLYAPKELYTRVALVNHNTVIQVLSETGLVGFIPFMLLIGAALLHMRRTARMLKAADSRLSAPAKALEIAFWGFLACAMSGGFATTWFPYILLGLHCALQQIALKAEAATPSLAGGEQR